VFAFFQKRAKVEILSVSFKSKNQPPLHEGKVPLVNSLVGYLHIITILLTLGFVVNTFFGFSGGF